MKLAVSSLLAFLGLGCTNVLYDGPARKADTVAIIMSGSGTSIAKIDDRTVGDGPFARFEVEPGAHLVEIDLSQENASADLQSRLRTACFDARAAGMYEVQTQGGGRLSRVTVVDVDSKRKVGHMCSPSAATSPNANVAVATDGESEEESGEHNGTSRSSWLVGLRLGVGEAIGGEEVSQVRYTNGGSKTLNTGDGVTGTLGLTLIPLWIDDSIGLGLGTSVGFKYGSLDSEIYSATISRRTFAGWFQLVFKATDMWQVYLALGTQKDSDISADESAGSESASVSLTSHWGVLSEAGLYGILTRHFGCGFLLRFVKIDYVAGRQNVSADSFGGEFTINFLF
jgi:hypothetical protein